MGTKSFRAAADRVVRQETSSAVDALRLLGSANQLPRFVASEEDAWEVRLASLAALGEYDAVALLGAKPAKLLRCHNLVDPAAVSDLVAGSAQDIRRYGAAMQLHSSVTLADGRTATSILVVPLTGVEQVEGSLVALRAGRSFGAADVITARSVSSLLALEVARSAADAQEARTRREALAMFELARIGLSRQPLGARLQAIVEMLASSLGYDVAQLWLLRGGGSLRLGASHPRESLVLEIARPRDHAALARALAGEVFTIDDTSLRAWVRRTTRHLIVAPLLDGPDVAGVLVLGRWRDGRADDDHELAKLSAEFIAGILTADARGQEAAAGGQHVEREEVGSLTGS